VSAVAHLGIRSFSREENLEELPLADLVGRATPIAEHIRATRTIARKFSADADFSSLAIHARSPPSHPCGSLGCAGGMMMRLEMTLDCPDVYVYTVTAWNDRG
jgi:hypothetical protein